MKRIWTVLTMMLLAGAPLAAVQASKRVQIDASMLVTGKITISKKGLVSGYQLDQPNKLPRPVVDLLAKFITHCRFKPVMLHGNAVDASARMTLRVIAEPAGKNHYRISVEGYQFGSTNSAYALGMGHTPLPAYPKNVFQDGVMGTVYLFLQVNRKGRVMHVDAQQVNLLLMPWDSGPIMMKRWRHDLAQAAENAAKQWTFKIPVKGTQASLPYWYARVAVEFYLTNYGQPLRDHDYGQWVPYIPGPRRPIPWLDHKQFASGSVDAQVPGTVYTVNQKLQLADHAKKS